MVREETSRYDPSESDVWLLLMQNCDLNVMLYPLSGGASSLPLGVLFQMFSHSCHSNFGLLGIGGPSPGSKLNSLGVLHGHSGLGALQTYALDASRCQDP